MTNLRVITEPLGGSALARLAAEGRAPGDWYESRPRTVDGWRNRAASVGAEFRGGAWLDALGPALALRDRSSRLARVADAGGVVVTTGQQSGLFGGPVYTWAKALGALAFANEIERATGIPAAPVFWAATDDADFAEASWTVVAGPGGAERLEIAPAAPVGAPMSLMPLGDVRPQFDALVRGAGSAVDPHLLAVARAAYAPDATVGGAYVALLRAFLEPLGIAVLDSSHAAVLDAERSILVRALDNGNRLAQAVRERDAQLEASGHRPQVAEVEGLSLVFAWRDGAKRRLPVGEHPSPSETLSPNVLLRPVVERSLLPTVAYLAGPGELSYFAQVTAVADALGAERPLGVPRWSGTIIEPHVAELLERYALTPDDLRDPHAAETRLARATLATSTASAMQNSRDRVEQGLSELEVALERDGMGEQTAAVDGVRRSVAHRFDRLERRLLAGVKRRETEMMRHIATARGALHPNGVRQERAVNVLPIVARHGGIVFERMLDQATEHARRLVDGEHAAEPILDASARIAADARGRQVG